MTMKLVSDLPNERRGRVEARLATNLMAWLTTVNSSGRPDSVPVWFYMLDDGRMIVYSQPGKTKLQNIVHNPQVSLGLDVTDIGRDVIRFEGTAVCDSTYPRADQVPGYAAKYAERVAAIFDTIERFADMFSEAIIITPNRLHA